ncbi:hypothetical protein [Mesorhizobium sp. CAU 1741]
MSRTGGMSTCGARTTIFLNMTVSSCVAAVSVNRAGAVVHVTAA